MKSGEKKKVIFAFVFLAIALTYLYFSIFGNSSGSSSAPQAASANDSASRRQSALNALNKGDAPTAASPSHSGRNLTDALSIDPVLRLDLLAKMESVKYEGSDRNIFQFYTAPPPPIPAPVRPVITGGNNQPQQIGPPPEPPKPTIPLKYYGVVTTLQTQARKACLQDGDDIFVAAEGETVNKRYRVVKINEQGKEHTVEVEDITAHVKATIPLQEDKTS